MAGAKKALGNVGFPTPDSIPETTGCRSFLLPDNDEWYGLLMGALQPLMDDERYYEWGSVTPAEAAAAFAEFIDDSYNSSCGATSQIPTPFWDNVTETDDEATPAEQIWYGEVEDAEVPADELTFVENAAIWTFTGFLALSGTPAAAILFHTVAPDFVIAMRGDDFAEVIRVIVDGVQHAQIDTTDLAGELIEVPIYAGESEGGHDILLVLRELL